MRMSLFSMNSIPKPKTYRITLSNKTLEIGGIMKGKTKFIFFVKASAHSFKNVLLRGF